ncbi:MAG: hypothetical protein JRH08_08930 [Deltaproteobacteria bacterium]|nr:hypothetical protein [Deltaproteobacteria bacterium]MBW1928495.1 hypothetical protein [Deltaproteobacteria bacterium]MBW2024171.1 hypothetical protein [Deltaproteobacteria bacterium]MBW2125804.1 hypothetical protein [Deltaproteobacteria bacterium]RLB22924.1 MAG: hypothetical protein DRG76_05510 [Deltaproteobacteria bacterium]
MMEKEKDSQEAPESINETAEVLLDSEDDLDVLEELEPQEPEKAEETKGTDFLAQDPVELDEPEDDTLEADGAQPEQESRGEEGETDQEEQGDSNGEAVELDEKEEGAGKKQVEGEASTKKEAPKEPQKDDSEQPDEVPTKKKASLLKRNAALIGVLFLGVIILGLGFVMGSRLAKEKQPKEPEDTALIISDTVTEEKLSPFFILLPASSRFGLLAKIDFVVKWDRICSIRFRESRYQMRLEIYRFLVDLFGKDIDLEKDRGLIIQGATRVMNQALGVDSVRITAMDMELI